MSFTSVLSDIGHGLKVFFTGAVTVATAAEPFIDVVFPGVSTLFNGIVTAVGTTEAAALAAGAQNGTGAQKLAAVVTAVEGNVNAYLLANGIKTPATTAQIETIVNGIVAALNALPGNTTSIPVA